MTSALKAATVSAGLVLTAACGGAPVTSGADHGHGSADGAEAEVTERSWCGLAITYLEDDVPQVVSSDTAAAVAARFRQQYFGEGAPELEASLGLAPPEISADVAVVVAGLREASGTGADTAVATPEFRAARSRIDAYNRASCPNFP